MSIHLSCEWTNMFRSMKCLLYLHSIIYKLAVYVIKPADWKNYFWIRSHMIDNKQLIALYTIVRRELVRMWRISTQVFLPPVITTALYFLIFGALIGKRIGQIGDVSYGTFIAPGLIMMSVIT